MHSTQPIPIPSLSLSLFLFLSPTFTYSAERARVAAGETNVRAETKFNWSVRPITRKSWQGIHVSINRLVCGVPLIRLL